MIGFQCATKHVVDVLPEGVTVINDKIKAKSNDTQATFKADGNAKLQRAKWTICGTATIDRGGYELLHSDSRFAS